ncbi:MAG: hypothetical protein Q8M94_16910 [Ignavibacteria bacterium]|nr:hypothetical protein [Ignavibacteria bacterium]
MKITENDIEILLIELLEKLGYHFIYAPDIAPDGEKPERENYEQIILTERLRKTDSQKLKQNHL